MFTLKSNAASDDANAAFDEAAAGGDPGTDSSACNLEDRPAACDLAIERLKDRNDFRNVAVGAFIATGAFAAATVTTYLLWPANRRPPSSSARTLVTPVVAPRFAGLAVSGRF